MLSIQFFLKISEVLSVDLLRRLVGIGRILLAALRTKDTGLVEGET